MVAIMRSTIFILHKSEAGIIKSFWLYTINCTNGVYIITNGPAIFNRIPILLFYTRQAYHYNNACVYGTSRDDILKGFRLRDGFDIDVINKLFVR